MSVKKGVQKTLIYIDIYFLSNYVVDVFLLVVFSWIINLKSSKGRLLLAAGVGTILACVVLYFNLQDFKVLLNIAIAAVMLFVFLYKRTLLSFGLILRYVLIWYFVAFSLGGLFQYITGASMSMLTLIQLVVVTLITAYAFLGRNRLKALRTKNDSIFKVTLYQKGRKISGYGLYDSGNSMIEPISGSIVIVGEYEYLYQFLSIGEKKYIEMFPELPEEWDGKTRIRSIPYCCIGSENGHLPGVPIDEVIVEGGGRSRLFGNCYIAVMNRKLGADNSYNFLLQSSMILND